ncbi:MAG: hypothetical protein C0483_17195 [Pirellula sp.]|nr:hypothetical protein [Pirellula sp.]
MQISSRTPDGERNTCPICGMEVWMTPSLDTRDATCPHCGCLLWFDEVPVVTDGTIEQLQLRDKVFGRALQKFGWPITTSATFVCRVPRDDGSRWLEAVETAENWDEFVCLLESDY